jgi:hypothetical protein
MTRLEKRLLTQWQNAEITTESFKEQFPIDLNYAVDFIISEIYKILKSNKKGELNNLIQLINFCENKAPLTYILNELLIEPNHKSHQFIAKLIQENKSPSSIPYIKAALESRFSYLQYTCSESEVIAKWFSHALASIGTEEAINCIKKFAQSSDEGIKKEMNYRLVKLKIKN